MLGEVYTLVTGFDGMFGEAPSLVSKVDMRTLVKDQNLATVTANAVKMKDTGAYCTLRNPDYNRKFKIGVRKGCHWKEQERYPDRYAEDGKTIIYEYRDRWKTGGGSFSTFWLNPGEQRTFKIETGWDDAHTDYNVVGCDMTLNLEKTTWVEGRKPSMATGPTVTYEEGTARDEAAKAALQAEENKKLVMVAGVAAVAVAGIYLWKRRR